MTTARQTRWLVASATICLLGLVYDIDGYALLDPDEGRNAEVAREMAATNDFVLPHLNGLPYLDKPVLYFAAGAAAMKLLGPTVLAARLPSVIFTMATLALVAWFGLKLFGPSGAWIAAIATAATPFTLAYSRTVIFDSALTFFVVLAMVAFYMAIEERRAVRRGAGQYRRPADPPTRRERGGGEWWTSLAWVAMAFGVLTKGPIALALPLMVAIPFAGWRRAWRSLADPVAVLLFAAIIAPWVLAVSRLVPGFLHYALVTETVHRLTTSELQRTGPIWYFLLVFPAAALPWSIPAFGTWRHARLHRDANGRMDGRVIYLLMWIAVPLIFFSLAQSKRPQYILPLVPAVALLVAGLWSGRHERVPGARVAAGALLAVGLFFVAGNRIVADLVPAGAAVAASIPATALALGTTCLAAGALAWFASRRREVLLVALSLPTAAIPFVSGRLMDEIARERSAFEIARALEPVAGPATQVVAVGVFPLSLPFYLRRTLVLATADGSELTSNYLVRHLDSWATPGSSLRPLDWWKEALINCTRPRVFLIHSDDRDARSLLEPRLELLVDTGKFAAYGPCGIENLAGTGR